MKVLLFGATGMIGQGVLRECLRASDVEKVVTVGRTPVGVQDSKLIDIVHGDLLNLSAIEEKLAGLNACFFCLGVSSAGMSEADYTRTTYDIALSAAQTLERLNPGMTFVFVSGAGTDSSEQGRTMWARVKGRTENALLRLGLDAYMFRPGLIRPLDGIRSKTRAYWLIYSLGKPLLPILHRALPDYVFSTRELGQAMLAVARRGFPKRILETRDMRQLLRG